MKHEYCILVQSMRGQFYSFPTQTLPPESNNNHGESDEEVRALMLNALGKEGWQLVAVGKAQGEMVRYYLMRPVTH